MVCIFTAKGSNFVFCRFYHPGYDTSGQVSRAKPAAHGNPHTSGPQFTQHSNGQGIHLPVCGLGQGQHPSWGHLEIRGAGAVFGRLAAMDINNSDPDIPTQGRLVPPECHQGPC